MFCFFCKKVFLMKKITPFITLFIVFFSACGKEKIQLTWQEQTSNVTFDLHAVHFDDAQNGIICGGRTWTSGFILRTRNGGATWQADSMLNKGFYGLGIEGRKTWITGNSGHVFEFTKNDTSFRWVGEPYDAWFRDVAVRGQTGIMVAGQAWQNGKLVRFDVKTGKRLQLDTFPQALESVCFSDSLTAHVVGYGLVLRSIDAGKTWKVQPNLTDDYFQSVCFPSEKIGYVVGQNGGILKTTDSGASWFYLKKSKNIGNPRFRAVFFSDILRGWICGEGGILWRTVDGGTSWQLVDGLPNVDFYDVFTSDTEGVLVGNGGRIVKFNF